MTKHGSLKKDVRRHTEETGQRYTEALTDLEGLHARMFHQPVGEGLVTHLRDYYGIDAVAVTKASQHHDHVFRVDRRTSAELQPQPEPRTADSYLALRTTSSTTRTLGGARPGR
jgi:hypothetical protein